MRTRPGYGAVVNQSQPKTAGIAIAAFVLSILCVPVGFVLGIIAYIKINDSRGAMGGKGLAIAAMCMPLMLVPIVGMLAAIAVPNFIRYQLRSKQSEAKFTLQAIRTSQEAFFADSGGYASSAPNPSAAPANVKVAWEGRPCPEDCKQDNLAACTELACIGYQASGPVYYRYACTATPPSEGSPAEFTCAAIADLDGDGQLGVMVLGTAHTEGQATIRAPLPELAAEACGAQVPANEVFNCTPNVF